MKVILAIGNPGKEYAATRHNTGFEVLDAVARTLGVDVSREKFSSLIGEAFYSGEKVVLVKPLTYVNNSGMSARSVLDFFSVETERFLVVCDDYNLPLGKLRFRRSGSSGGHNGLESVITHLNTDAFARLRVGIGAPEGMDASDYVLGKFAPGERDASARAVATARDAVLCWLEKGIDAAMANVN